MCCTNLKISNFFITNYDWLSKNTNENIRKGFKSDLLENIEL